MPDPPTHSRAHLVGELEDTEPEPQRVEEVEHAQYARGQHDAEPEDVDDVPPGKGRAQGSATGPTMLHLVRGPA